LSESVEVEFSSQHASIHRNEGNIHGLDPCYLFLVTPGSAQLCAQGIENPDGVFGMLER